MRTFLCLLSRTVTVSPFSGKMFWNLYSKVCPLFHSHCNSDCTTKFILRQETAKVTVKLCFCGVNRDRNVLSFEIKVCCVCCWPISEFSLQSTGFKFFSLWAKYFHPLKFRFIFWDVLQCKIITACSVIVLNKCLIYFLVVSWSVVVFVYVHYLH
jgi:hypothetical protein